MIMINTTKRCSSDLLCFLSYFQVIRPVAGFMKKSFVLFFPACQQVVSYVGEMNWVEKILDLMQEAVVQTDLFSKHLTEGRDLREIDIFTNDRVVPIFSQAQIHFASAPDVTYKFCAISAEKIGFFLILNQVLHILMYPV